MGYREAVPNGVDFFNFSVVNKCIWYLSSYLVSFLSAEGIRDRLPTATKLSFYQPTKVVSLALGVGSMWDTEPQPLEL